MTTSSETQLVASRLQDILVKQVDGLEVAQTELSKSTEDVVERTQSLADADKAFAKDLDQVRDSLSQLRGDLTSEAHVLSDLLKAHAKRFEDQETRVADLEAQGELATSQLEQLEHDRASQKEQFTELEAEFSVAQSNLTDLKSGLGNVEETVSTLGSETESLSSSIGQVESAGEEMRGLIAQLNEEISGQGDATSELNARLSGQLAQLEASLDQALDGINETTDEFRRKLGMAELQAAQFRRWQSEIDERIERIGQDVEMRVQTVDQNLESLTEAVNSQHHIFVTWKAALKARIFKVLGIRH